MTGLNHGITGAVIALTVRQPALAVPLAFLSHFATDMIPHWDYGTGRRKDKLFGRKFDVTLAGDFILSVILMIFLAFLFLPGQILVIWACMVAAASPDLMWAYYRLYKEHIRKREVKLDPFAQLHHKIQWSESSRGLYVEIVWFLVLFSYILIRYYSISTSPV